MRPAFEPLFSGLEAKDAGIIVEKLKTMKIPYQLTDQGKTIKVPESQVYEARIQLASSGTLGGGGMGFELFDQNKFGQTDFEQQVGYQRALQEELRRTVVQMDGVEQARVHLVLPQKSVFVNDQGTPTASVALKLKPTARVKPEQVQGICDLFVGSVEGLKPENVHIIDTEGNVLSDNLKSSDPKILAARATFDQQKAQRDYEKELEKRVQLMLSRVMGQNNAVVMVTADLDFSQQQTTSTIASNPDNLKISEHAIKETGTGQNSGGVPGVDSNIPTTPVVQGLGSSDYSREDNTTNYQVSTIQDTVVKAPGGVRRLSASVVVNEGTVPADVQKVRDVVAAAIGYDTVRGDAINVSGMVFDDSYQKKIEAEMAQAEAAARDRERFIAYVLAGGALLAVILILAVILLRRRSAQRVDEDREEGFIAVRDMEAEMEAEQGKEVGKDKQNQVRNIARDNPRELAEVLKVWIKDKG
jgi:flagellar M-ring protein FliF